MLKNLKENTSPFEVLLLYLSLIYGADFGRSRLVFLNPRFVYLGTISGSNASLTKSKSTVQIELEELEEVECVEEEKKRMRKETHFDVFMYQLRSFKTLDSYWSMAQSTSVSNNQYVQRVSLDSLCASIFQNRLVFPFSKTGWSFHFPEQVVLLPPTAPSETFLPINRQYAP